MSTIVNEPRTPYITIKPTSGWQALNLREIWQFRDLLFSLADRDMKLRYRQTVLGASWVILQPLITAAIFTLVFSVMAKMPEPGKLPYFITAFTGLLAWNVFNNILNRASGSLIANSNLISKIYFPRLILPLATIYSTVVDFLVSLVFLAVLMLLNHIPFHWTILLLPLWLLVVVALSIGFGMYSAAVMVSYRDVQYVVPFLTQMFFYLTPVLYTVKALKTRLLIGSPILHLIYKVYMLNPLVSLFETFRYCLFHEGSFSWFSLLYSAVFSVLIFFGGALAFKKMERRFADVI